MKTKYWNCFYCIWLDVVVPCVACCLLLLQLHTTRKLTYCERVCIFFGAALGLVVVIRFNFVAFSTPCTCVSMCHIYCMALRSATRFVCVCFCLSQHIHTHTHSLQSHNYIHMSALCDSRSVVLNDSLVLVYHSLVYKSLFEYTRL